MADVRNLRVWHAARELALGVIDALPERRARRVPGLRGQAIRAATSIAANLAEGAARTTQVDFLHFVEIALSSLNELDTHLLLARDAKVVSTAEHARLLRSVVIVRKMLLALRRTVAHRLPRPRRLARD